MYATKQHQARDIGSHGYQAQSLRAKAESTVASLPPFSLPSWDWGERGQRCGRPRSQARADEVYAVAGGL